MMARIEFLTSYGLTRSETKLRILLLNHDRFPKYFNNSKPNIQIIFTGIQAFLIFSSWPWLSVCLSTLKLRVVTDHCDLGLNDDLDLSIGGDVHHDVPNTLSKNAGHCSQRQLWRSKFQYRTERKILEIIIPNTSVWAELQAFWVSFQLSKWSHCADKP